VSPHTPPYPFSKKSPLLPFSTRSFSRRPPFFGERARPSPKGRRCFKESSFLRRGNPPPKKNFFSFFSDKILSPSFFGRMRWPLPPPQASQNKPFILSLQIGGILLRAFLFLPPITPSHTPFFLFPCGQRKSLPSFRSFLFFRQDLV